MATKTITELSAVNNLSETDVFVIDDGAHNYKISWSTLKALLGTVASMTVDNTAGTITLTLSNGSTITVTPHDPTKQDTMTFDNIPTANSNNPVKSGGVKAALDDKLDKTSYVRFTGASEIAAGTDGFVPAPAAGNPRYLSSEGVWNEPDSAPTQNSVKLITSDAVYAALQALTLDAATKITGILPVGHGGSGLNASPSLLVNLASAAAANVMQASPRPGVTGILQIENGGTKAATAAGARTNLEVYSKAEVDGAIAALMPNAMVRGESNKRYLKISKVSTAGSGLYGSLYLQASNKLLICEINRDSVNELISSASKITYTVDTANHEIVFDSGSVYAHWLVIFGGGSAGDCTFNFYNS